LDLSRCDLTNSQVIGIMDGIKDAVDMVLKRRVFLEESLE
jgi:hypothetical protein